jgi:lysophospholipase L1-like esterase
MKNRANGWRGLRGGSSALALLSLVMPLHGGACRGGGRRRAFDKRPRLRGGPATASTVTTTRPSTTRSTTGPATLPAPFKWEKEIRALESADRKNPPSEDAVWFTGSSTIRRWTTMQVDFPGLAVVNHGFGGSMISDAIYFADRLLAGRPPRVIVLYSGGNDINAGRTPERVCEDFKTFVGKVRVKYPAARIVFMGIGPSVKRWAQAEKQKKANRLIREFMGAGRNMDYVEAWDEFLDRDGKPRPELFVADGLHNNAEGYRIRAEILRPYLD